MALPKLRRNARKKVTGTSYSSQGAVEAPKSGMKELGSSAVTPVFDPVPQLASRQQQQGTYIKMVRSDASTRVSLRAGKAPVLGADYFVEPYSSDPHDLIIAEFVHHNLFEGMNIPFLKFLEQALKMYESGFSVFEHVWEVREWSPKRISAGANRKQYTMLKKLAIRPASTITKFVYDDNGGPTGVEHLALDANGQSETVSIGIDNLVIFTFDGDGGNLEGNSILRSAYPHWYRKNHLYNIDGIQKERHGIGVPDIELQPGFSEDDKKAAHELGANLRVNERGYIVRTPMLKIGFAKLEGQPVDALESAVHHDVMIMKNVMVQFLNAGLDSSGGGRATSATAMDMFLKAMRYVANSICDTLNMYLIPKIVAYNFDTDRFPYLCVKNIGEAKDLQMWSTAMSNLIKNEAITVDEDTENWIRGQVDMPRLTTARPTKTQEEDEVDPTQNGKGRIESGNIGKSESSGVV